MFHSPIDKNTFSMPKHFLSNIHPVPPSVIYFPFFNTFAFSLPCVYLHVCVQDRARPRLRPRHGGGLPQLYEVPNVHLQLVHFCEFNTCYGRKSPFESCEYCSFGTF